LNEYFIDFNHNNIVFLWTRRARAVQQATFSKKSVSTSSAKKLDLYLLNSGGVILPCGLNAK